MTDEQQPVPFKVSHPRRISWLTIVLALLTIGTFLAIAGPDTRYYFPQGMGGGVSYTTAEPSTVAGRMMFNEVSVQTSASMMGRDLADSSAYYPYPNPSVPATDTREFLKVNYDASMQTRDVQGLTRRVETTVRGYDGRVDQVSSSPRSGYVGFVVPASKYEAFRTELEGLVGSRFLTVNISSQNLLPQKQSIEEQQKQADATLADYKTARQQLVNAHASTVKSLQSQIDADVQELASLRAQTQTYEIQARIQAVTDDWTVLKQRLANENASYSVQLKNADANVKYAQDWQTAVQKQDTALMDNVATVSGSVSIRWISLWEMTQLYLPGYWIPGIFAVLTLCSYLWDRRRFGTT